MPVIDLEFTTATGWTDSANAIDGNDATEASVSILATSTGATLALGGVSAGNYASYRVTGAALIFRVDRENGVVQEAVQLVGTVGTSQNRADVAADWGTAAAGTPSTITFGGEADLWGLPLGATVAEWLDGLEARVTLANTAAKTRIGYIATATLRLWVLDPSKEYGREPVTIVEIEQPRCGLRFGTSPCTATGTPKCYNTYWTCKDKANYDPTGSIKWRFMQNEAGIYPLYAEPTANDIETNPIYSLEGVSLTGTRINLGASREGESPFGTRAGIRATFRDIQWDDHVGDFYLADRVDLPADRNFWQLWKARNPFYPGVVMTVYEGYRGQALGDMQSRLALVNSVQGPDGNGRVTVEGDDPLQLADRKRALFPRATDIRLIGNIDASTTTVRVFGLQADLDAVFGNTALFYLRIGDEILAYAGRTDDGDGEWTLTGVQRGQRNTQADSHEDGEGCQRVGAFDLIRMYKAAEYLLKNHTQIDNAYINAAGQWDTEGDRFLATLVTTATIPDPEPVERLVGELCRDGLFSIWWDERAKVIPLLAVRPPQETPIVISDELNILADTAQLTERPDDRMTRVSIFYGERNPLDRDAPQNYRNRRIRVDAEVESENATDGTIRDVEIFSRWIRTDGNAFLVAAQLLLRYRLPPQYLRIELDAKDRAIDVGDVLDVTTRVVRDTEGRPLIGRWQVISAEEIKAGDRVRLELQSYQFVGKFAIIMANDAPDYADATEEERLSGCWLADDSTGLMPDGSDPYLLQ